MRLSSRRFRAPRLLRSVNATILVAAPRPEIDRVRLFFPRREMSRRRRRNLGAQNARARARSARARRFPEKFSDDFPRAGIRRYVRTHARRVASSRSDADCNVKKFASRYTLNYHKLSPIHSVPDFGLVFGAICHVACGKCT